MKDKPILEPAAAYLRKSREDRDAEARGEGETLLKHKKALFRVAKERGIVITKIFEEVVSGESIINRPEMMNLLREVNEKKWRAVLCMEIDRLGRGDMEDQGLILRTFKTSGTMIVTPRKIYDLNDEMDEEYSEFEAFMARKELKIITRRLQGGRLRSVEDGNYLGARPPYGYEVERKGRDRILIPNEEQAPVVQLIFDLYVNGNMGCNKIAEELTRLGKPTYGETPWRNSSVLTILKNAVYTGRLQWKKKETKKSASPTQGREVKTRPREEWIDVPGKHQPIISKELFDKAQNILKRKYHVPYQLVTGITNPMAGIIRCGFCGASMIYRPYANRQPHILCYNQLCGNKSSRVDYVEKALLDGLRRWIKGYKRKYNKPDEKSANFIEENKKALRALRAKLKQYLQQKDKLYDLLERGIYDEAIFVERSNKVAANIAETTDAIAATEKNLAAEIEREQAKSDIIPKVEEVLRVYETLQTPADKNVLLKSVLDYAVYQKEKHQKNDDFTLVLYPRLPAK